MRGYLAWHGFWHHTIDLMRREYPTMHEREARRTEVQSTDLNATSSMGEGREDDLKQRR